MYILISLLLIPFILILVFALFAVIFAWAWVKRLWYSITGKKPSANDPFSFYYNMRAGGNADRSQSSSGGKSSAGGSRSSADNSRTSASSSQQKKIFSQSDGEYVDFEIVE